MVGATNNVQKYCGNQRKRTGCAWQMHLEYKRTVQYKYNNNRREKRRAIAALKRKNNPKPVHVTKLLEKVNPNSFMRGKIVQQTNVDRHVPVKWTPWFMEQANG